MADVAGYLLIGGVSVAVDLGLLLLLAEVLDVPLPLATASAFLASVGVNFGLNRLLAGGTGAGLLRRQLVRYALLLAANLVLTVAVVSGADAAGIPYVAAKVAVVLASTCWNYLLYRAWVFAPPR